jgi:hypothetical protein
MKQIKQNGMYALLIAVAAVIGITIYASCSADEDFDYSSDNNELFTRAEREMGRGVEDDTITWYYSPQRSKTFHFKYPYTFGTIPDTIYSECDLSFQLYTRWFTEFHVNHCTISHCSAPITKAIVLKINTINNNYIFSYHFWSQISIYGQESEGESDIVYDTIPINSFMMYNNRLK